MRVLNAWISSLRLKTLPLSCCGIVTGNALVVAYGEKLNIPIFIFSLLTAIALQVMSNLANDYGDVAKGADTENRLGPNRGMQEGLINAQQMKVAILFVSAITLVLGIVLISIACHTVIDIIAFVLLGLLSIFAAILYTVGNKSYGYYGLGDLAVLLFFGYVGVMGSFFLQTHHIGLYSFLPATACGILGVLVLNVNNMRDVQEDTLHGKRTIPVRLGMRKARYYHFILLTGSIIFLCLFAFMFSKNTPYSWLFLLALPLFYLNGYAVYCYEQPVQFQKQLGVAVKINIFTLSLFSIGLFLG